MKMMRAETARVKRGMVLKTILGLLAVGGLIAVAAVAPNAVQALTLFTGRPRRHHLGYVKNTFNRLAERGLVRRQKGKGGKIYFAITERGKSELAKYQLGGLKIKKPWRWDGKWRVLIFDVKEYRRGDRDRLRDELISLGFVRLQNSVWVHPYGCEEVVMLLKTSFRFGRQLLYLVVEKLENDGWLRRAFNLM